MQDQTDAREEIRLPFTFQYVGKKFSAYAINNGGISYGLHLQDVPGFSEKPFVVSKDENGRWEMAISHFPDPGLQNALFDAFCKEYLN